MKGKPEKPVLFGNVLIIFSMLSLVLSVLSFKINYPAFSWISPAHSEQFANFSLYALFVGVILLLAASTLHEHASLLIFLRDNASVLGNVCFAGFAVLVVFSSITSIIGIGANEVDAVVILSFLLLVIGVVLKISIPRVSLNPLESAERTLERDLLLSSSGEYERTSHPFQLFDYLLICLVGLRVLVWFLPDLSQIHFGGDIVFPFNPSVDANKVGAYYLWSDMAEGSPNLAGPVSLFPLEFFRMFFVIGLRIPAIVQLYQYLNYTLPGVSMYYLFTTVYNGKFQRLGAMVSVIFYMFSPAFLGAFSPIYLPYGFFPIYLALFWKALNSCRRTIVKYSIVNGILFFAIFGVFPNYRALLHIVGLLSLTGGFLVAIRYTTIKRLATTGVAFLLMGVALNLREIIASYFWFVNLNAPAVVTTKYTSGGVALGTLDAILFNGIPRPAYLALPGLYYVGLLLIFLALSALLMRPQNRIPILFALVSILGVAISSATVEGSIQGNLWSMVYNSSYLLLPLRGDGEIGAITSLGYALLLGFSTVRIYGKLLNAKTTRILAKPFIALTIVIILLVGWPFVTGTFFHDSSGDGYASNAGYNIPTAFYKADQWFSTHSTDDYRVLILPNISGYATYHWNITGQGFGGCRCYVGGFDSFIISLPTIATSSGFGSAAANATSSIYSQILRGNITKAVETSGTLNVRYILVDGYIQRSSLGPPNQYCCNATALSTRLTRFNLGERVAQFGNITIFEINNNLVRPRVYATNSHLQSVQLSFQQINPTLYKVKVNGSQPFSIVLSETYNAGWGLYQGAQTVFGIPFGQKLNAIHSVAAGYGNEWSVNITRNGTYDFVLYYSPQTYYSLSSYLALLLVAAFVAYFGIQKLKESRKDRFASPLTMAVS